MKVKIGLIFIVCTIISVIIYFYTRSDEVNILALGDATASAMTPFNVKGYSFNDYLKEEYKDIHKLNNYYEYASVGKTVKELIYEIKDNIKINGDVEIKRAINEASIITISIGMDELAEDKITKDILYEYEDDIKELLSMIKMLNNKKVYVMGLYTIKEEEYLNIYKINSIIKDECRKNNFIFIDIFGLIKEEYYFNKDSYYLNYMGHKALYEAIKKEL